MTDDMNRSRTTQSKGFPWIGATLAAGIGTAVAMWCAWFVTHLPGLEVPGGAPVTASLLLGAWLVGAVYAARSRPTTSGITGALRLGIGAAMVAATLNLLLLGSFLAEPAGTSPEDGPGSLRPAAGLIVLGFLGLGLVVGAIGGVIGHLTAGAERSAEHAADRWLARLALVTALSIAPLLFIGGLVTSTKSGMAVPDWPQTYGANMFLYPVALMADPRIFLEHTHRLFGSLVGLTSLALMVYTLAACRKPGVKPWAVTLFALVCVQGVLGGFRVTENNLVLALAHGVLAQFVFAVAVAMAVWVSPGYAAALSAPVIAGVRTLRVVATGLVHSLILQLIMGATFRHLKHAGVGEHEAAEALGGGTGSGAGGAGAMHALWSHVVFSVVVVGFAVAAGFAAVKRSSTRDDAGRSLGVLGKSLLVVVGVQFLMGWVALWAVFDGKKFGPVPTPEQLDEAPAILPWHALAATSHQANGALLLALATATFVWARQLSRAERAAR